MIKRVIIIDCHKRTIHGEFVDLDRAETRYNIIGAFETATVPFGGKVHVWLDQLAVYRVEQEWCAVGNFPMPMGGRVIFYQMDEEGNLEDFMRTEAFFVEQVNWISRAEAQTFLVAKGVATPDMFNTLALPKMPPQLKVVK